MPRPKTIYVDRRELLTGIEREYQADLTRLDTGGIMDGYYLGRTLDDGTPVNFPKFVGRALTDSQRLRHQQELRRCEAAGLVRIYGAKASRVTVTTAGLAWLAEANAAEPQPSPTVDPLVEAHQ